MQPSPRTPIAKFLSLIACLAAAVLYLALASSQYLAYRFAERTDWSSLHLACHLDPWNAEYSYKLGRILTLLQRWPEASDAFTRATELNSHDATYWLNLARTQGPLGYPQRGLYALQQATAVDPKSASVAWEVGNLYLTERDYVSAFDQFRTVLEAAPSLSGQVIPLCWNARPDLDALLNDALPASPAVYSSFLEFLISKNETASATKVWMQIVKLGQPAELSYVFDYIHYLIGQRQPAQARMVWEQAAPLCGLQSYQPSRDNLVVNGDFSSTILNGGFDWIYDKRPDVSLELDPTQPHLGPRSLLISYDSGGLDDSGIRQLIPVEPNTAFYFSAYFKTQQLEGAGGPRFFLQDFYSEKPYFESEDLKDSEVWRPTNGDFKTGPKTSLLSLQVKRVPSGGAIRGKIWIDGIRLRPGNEESGQ
jgi:tetratricopeptide (TPR) repeat protein